MKVLIMSSETKFYKKNQLIFETIENNPDLTNNELAKLLNCSTKTIQRKKQLMKKDAFCFHHKNLKKQNALSISDIEIQNIYLDYLNTKKQGKIKFFKSYYNQIYLNSSEHKNISYECLVKRIKKHPCYIKNEKNKAL